MTSLAHGPEVSFVVPDLAGAVFSIDVLAGDDAGASDSWVPGLAAGTTGLSVQVDHAPTLTSPFPRALACSVGSARR